MNIGIPPAPPTLGIVACKFLDAAACLTSFRPTCWALIDVYDGREPGKENGGRRDEVVRGER